METGTPWRRERIHPFLTMPNTTTSWSTSPWRWNERRTPSRLKPTRSSADLRAPVAGVGPGGQPVHAEPLERQRGDQRLGLEVRAAAPPAVAEPRADGGVAVAGGELRQAGDADRPVLVVDDQEVEQLAALALAGQGLDVGLGLGQLRVGPPREEARDGRVGGELEQPRRVLGAGVAQRQRRAADDERVGLVRRLRGAHRPDATNGTCSRCSTTCTATSRRSRR